MSFQEKITAAKASFGRFDSELTVNQGPGQFAAVLTIKLKVFLQQVNPSRAPSSLFLSGVGPLPLPPINLPEPKFELKLTGLGVHKDADKNEYFTSKWDTSEWQAFSRNYQSQGQNFWDDQFTLLATDRTGGPSIPLSSSTSIRPDQVGCRFQLLLAGSKGDSHVAIDVVRLATDQKNAFRSHALLYTNYDLQTVWMLDSFGQWHPFQTFLHEIGHALGLPHIGEMVPNRACSIEKIKGLFWGQGSNANVCYDGRNAAESANVMGKGTQLAPVDALPWLKRVLEHTGTSEKEWKAVMRKH